jgi:hypothetical protein
MVRPEVAAARVARAQAWLAEAESLRDGIPPLRVFLEAVAAAAGL